MDQHIINKSDTSIVNTLVGKINDELTKAKPPFPRITKEAILSGMGVTDNSTESPANMSSINAGTGLNGIPITQTQGVDFDPNGSDFDINEGRIYFYALTVIILIVGVFTWVFWNPKRRK